MYIEKYYNKVLNFYDTSKKEGKVKHKINRSKMRIKRTNQNRLQQIKRSENFC